MEKKPFVTKEQLEEIAKTYPTPFYLYDDTANRRNIYPLILGMIMFSSISSSGRNGAISSNGGETKVPSGNRFAEDFGSKFWSVDTMISQITGPSMARVFSTASASCPLCSALT